MTTIIDLNAVGNPEQVAMLLRKAADEYRESCLRLQSDWQDEAAGKVWDELAKVLDKAADSCDKACKKFFV